MVIEIRNLDSDRKSLVYDNYSKLLAATSTILRMRTNMDPMAPTTHTLGPAISHIAETAASLARDMGALPRPTESKEESAESKPRARKAKEVETVRWVLDTPRRLRQAVREGKKDQAVKEWKEVEVLLDKWKSVPGVQELQETCDEILEGPGEAE